MRAVVEAGQSELLPRVRDGGEEGVSGAVEDGVLPPPTLGRVEDVDEAEWEWEAAGSQSVLQVRSAVRVARAVQQQVLDRLVLALRR